MRVARLTVARRCPRVALVAFVTVGLSVAAAPRTGRDRRESAERVDECGGECFLGGPGVVVAERELVADTKAQRIE